MTIKELLLAAKKKLKEANVQEPEASAEFLLAEALGLSRTALFANLEQEISSKNISKFNEYISRRKKHEPVWQIVGKVKFWGLPFTVNQNVLVPRPETELLVQEALKEVKRIEKKEKSAKILDVGTGSGTIAVALAYDLSLRGANSDEAISRSPRQRLAMTKIYASDVSEEALKVAKQNAKLNKVEKYIEFKESDLFSAWNGQKFDIVCANLPYIPEEDMDGLALDVHHYEPRLTLSGGSGGLIIYEEFLKQLPEYLEENAKVFCEIGKDQGKSFCELVKKYLPEAKCEIRKDLAGIDRIVIIKTARA